MAKKSKMKMSNYKAIMIIALLGIASLTAYGIYSFLRNKKADKTSEPQQAPIDTQSNDDTTVSDTAKKLASSYAARNGGVLLN